MQDLEFTVIAILYTQAVHDSYGQLLYGFLSLLELEPFQFTLVI